MDAETNVNVILDDNTIVKTTDVMERLIASEVSNTILNNEIFDLSSPEQRAEVAELICDYLEVATGIQPDAEAVFDEVNRQLD